jgi:transcriptional regulator with XRE-family HTH domain
MRRPGKLRLSYVGGNLRALLIQHRMGYVEAAAKCSMPINTIKNVAKEINKPTIQTLINIATAFDVSLDWLCSDNGNTDVARA